MNRKYWKELRGFDRRLYTKREFYWKYKLSIENGIVLKKKKIIILGWIEVIKVMKILERRNCILLEFIWRKNKIVKVYWEN